MEGDVRGRVRAAGRAAEDAARAVAAIDSSDAREPILVGYHPVSRMNPYQTLLYGHGWQRGVAAIPLIDRSELDELDGACANGVATVFHLHWTNGVLHGARDATDVAQRRAAFLGLVDRFLDRGGRLVWTVHNVLPHDAARPDDEAALQQAVVDRATVVHGLSSDTIAAVEPWFRIPPEKLLWVPHPNYIGAYPGHVTREAARWELGLGDQERVALFLGTIRPYKGLEILVDAIDALNRASPRRWRLVIAGALVAGAAVDALIDRCVLDPAVALHLGRVPVEDVALFLRAADVLVLPYAESLNSGVLMLALSFGLPVVVPGGAFRDVIETSFAQTFTPGDAADLATVLDASDHIRSPAAHEAALARARAYDPAELSIRFADGLRSRVLPDGAQGA